MAQEFLKHILLAVNALDPSQRAVDTALGLAAQLGSETVFLAYIIDTDLLRQLLDQHVLVQDELDELIESFEAQGKRLTRGYRQAAGEAGVTLKPFFCHGRFYQAVSHCIRSCHADAVVMDGCRTGRPQADAVNERQLVLAQSAVPVFLV